MNRLIPHATVALAAACSPIAPRAPEPINSEIASTAVGEASGIEQWKRAFKRASSGDLQYRIASPASSSPRPLVLVLHGSGAMGSDNEAQLGPFAASWAQLLADEDAPIVVVPQVPERSADYVMCGGSPCASRPGPSFARLVQLLDSLLASGQVDVDRVYVVGFSMGGSAALQLALTRPKVIAGVVAFAPVPPGRGRITELTGLPLFIVHGSSDTENPFNVIRDWVEALNAVGGTAKLCIREGMGHQVPDTMLQDPSWRRRLLRRERPFEVC